MMPRPPSKSFGNHRTALEPEENCSGGVLNGDVNHVQEQSLYSRPVYSQPELRRLQFEVDVLKRNNARLKSCLMQKGADNSLMPIAPPKTDGLPFQHSPADAYSQAQIYDIPNNCSQGHSSHDQQHRSAQLRNSNFVSYINRKACSQKLNLQAQTCSPDTLHTQKLQALGPSTTENNSLSFGTAANLVPNPEMGDSLSVGHMQQQLTAAIKEQCGALAEKYNELVEKFQDCQIAYYCLTKQNIELEALNMELQKNLEMMQQTGQNCIGVNADAYISEFTPGFSSLLPVENCADLASQVALLQTAIDLNVLPHELPAYGSRPGIPCSSQNMPMLRGPYRPNVSAEFYGSPTSVLQAPDSITKARTTVSTSFNTKDDLKTVKDKCPIPDDNSDYESSRSSSPRVVPHVPKMISIRANGGPAQILRGRSPSSKGFARRPAHTGNAYSTARSADHLAEFTDTITRSPKPASATSTSASFIPERPQRIRLMRPLVSTDDVSSSTDRANL